MLICSRVVESEPLIPATTSFLLTTNSALLPPAPASSASAKGDDAEEQLNTLAFGRYFERPEVRRAYKEQLLIQTPDFIELSQDAHVGGRFRPRGSEDVRAPVTIRMFMHKLTSVYLSAISLYHCAAIHTRTPTRTVCRRLVRGIFYCTLFLRLSRRTGVP